MTEQGLADRLFGALVRYRHEVLQAFVLDTEGFQRRGGAKGGRFSADLAGDGDGGFRAGGQGGKIELCCGNLGTSSLDQRHGRELHPRDGVRL